MAHRASSPLSAAWLRAGAGALAWVVGWAALFALDGRLDLANLALLLVLVAAVASLWWPLVAALAASTASVLAFNWFFVPPRGAFTVDLHQHALLLVALWAVSALIAVLMARLTQRTAQLASAAEQAQQLRALGETLRDSADPAAEAGTLRELLQRLSGRSVAVLVLRDALPATDDDAATLCAGDANADERAGLWHALRQGQALGPGTGRHAGLPAWYLPLRGRGAAFGAALLRDVTHDDPALREAAQALADQLGIALQRAQSARAQQRAHDEAQTQSVRNALLAAIAHDHRTPLATITSAASSLLDQGSRLQGAQRDKLARTIVDEAARLARLTDNTLQLARLDAPGMTLACDWESAEDLAGSAIRRARQQAPERTLHVRVEPGLPLLWCDAMLISQLLDNLLHNALKYSPTEAPVELLVRRADARVMFAVRDRGPGVPPAWRERVFQVFQRGPAGDDATAEAQLAQGRPGSGVGLAVCRAIARVHGGELRVRPRAHGGSAFECLLPVREAPAQPGAESPGSEGQGA